VNQRTLSKVQLQICCHDMFHDCSVVSVNHTGLDAVSAVSQL